MIPRSLLLCALFFCAASATAMIVGCSLDAAIWALCAEVSFLSGALLSCEA